MKQDYYPPIFYAGAFHCPHCSVYSNQTWSARVVFYTSSMAGQGLAINVKKVSFSLCSYCKENAIWVGEILVFPQRTTAPQPNVDMPQDIMRDYLEAVSISDKSPRGAAALLRLAIQKLCIHLGQKGKAIDDDIANLVQNGLPVRIQKALDIVRVIGNNAVHPGVIDLNDNSETVYALFGLLNQIVQDRITQPKDIDELYKTLPDTAIQHIVKRDAPKP